jgi:hypothetical protein
MARYYPFNREDIFPSFFANRIQDFLATARTDLRFTDVTATKVAVIPDPDLGVAGISIDGRWRFNDATVERSHPGGAKGTYTVWAVALDNDVDNSPDPFTDHTDYAFDLRITNGEDPSGAGVEIFQKIGEIDWSGAAIEAIRQTFGSVTGPQLADGALASEAPSDITWTRAAGGGLLANFKANSVGANELADESVDTNALIDLAVVTAKVAALAITEGKLAENSVATAKIVALAVTTAKIAAAAVTEEKLGNESVAEAKIKALAVTAAKLAAESVTEAKIGALAVTAAKIAAEAVTTGKIANLAVTAAKIAAEAVETAKIANLAVTAAKLAEAAVETAKIKDKAVTAAKIGLLPGARVKRSGASVNITSRGEFKPINFDAEDWDNDGMHSLEANTSRLTCITGGIYIVHGLVQFSGPAAAGKTSEAAKGDRVAALVKNGSPAKGPIPGANLVEFSVPGRTPDPELPGSGGNAIAVSAPCQLSPGDFVELWVWQNSEETLKILSGDGLHEPFFSAVFQHSL